METTIIVCNPFLSADDRFFFSIDFEDRYGFWPALAMRIKTSNV